MSVNFLETVRHIAKEAASALEYELGPLGMFYRDVTSEFTDAYRGMTVQIRAPVQFRGQEGPSFAPSPVQDRNIPITIDRQFGDAIQMVASDFTFRESMRAERFSVPIARSIATEMIRDVLSRVLLVPNDMTPAWTTTPPAVVDYSEVLRATARLTDIGGPPSDRVAIIQPTARVALANFITNLGGPTGPSTQALRNGEIGNLDNCRTFESALLPTLVNGARAPSGITIPSPAAVSYATASANDYTQTVTLAQTASNTTNWLRRGEIITFAGCFAVNAVTKEPLPFLRQFVVMQNADLVSNQASVVISPPMIVSGPYQTIAALPAASAAVTVNGNAGLSIRNNIVMHREALALAMPQKQEPPAALAFSRASYRGFSLSVEIGREPLNDQSVLRYDAYWGVRLIQPDHAVRWTGRL